MNDLADVILAQSKETRCFSQLRWLRVGKHIQYIIYSKF